MTFSNRDSLDGGSRMSGTDVLLTLLLEAGFVVLPLLVHLGIVLEANSLDATVHFVESSEWSFAAIVLFGRTLIWISAASAGIPEGRLPRLRLTQFAVIALGLVPSVLWLARRLSSDTPSTRLVMLQLWWFVISLILFIVLAGIGERQGSSKHHLR